VHRRTWNPHLPAHGAPRTTPRSHELHAQAHARYRSIFWDRQGHRAAPGRGRQHVYAGVRKEADGDQLARAADQITPLLLDVTNAGQIADAVAVIGEHAPAGLDGLVNNAGYGLACPTELVPLDAFRRQLDVNVTGQLAVTQAMLPLLRLAAGRIVVVGTIGVRFNPPFAGALDASKAALTALADSLRQELAPWDIRVVLIEPATINSGAADKVSRDAEAAMAAASQESRALYQTTFAEMLKVMTAARETAARPTSRPPRSPGR
jgi:NAD(P)-dependent dehydrogenase (short-subunit alcohol dehydrogenase family)